MVLIVVLNSFYLDILRSRSEPILTSDSKVSKLDFDDFSSQIILDNFRSPYIIFRFP